MRKRTAPLFLCVALASCGGTPTSPAPLISSPSTPSTPVVAFTIQITMVPNGSATSVASGGRCRVGAACVFDLTVKVTDASLRPVHITIAPGDGSEQFVLDAADEVTHKTWSHVYAAAGSYFTTVTLYRGGIAADISNIGVFVS